MDNAARISPTLFLGADASPRAPTVSGLEAWSSLVTIAGVFVVALAGSGWAVWFVATST
jgi:hypothetical protein